MSSSVKALYIAEAEKRKVDYANLLNFYNWLMAAGHAEKEESDKSMSKVGPSSGSKNKETPCYVHLVTHPSHLMFGISYYFQFFYKWCWWGALTYLVKLLPCANASTGSTHSGSLVHPWATHFANYVLKFCWLIRFGP